MRRAVLILAILGLFTVPASTQGRLPSRACSVDNRDDTPALCIAAHELGMRRYVTDIIAQSTTTTAGLFNLYQGRSQALGGGVNCFTATTPLLPSSVDIQVAPTRFIAAGNGVKATTIRLASPIVVPQGKDLCVVGDAANPVTVQLLGYVAP